MTATATPITNVAVTRGRFAWHELLTTDPAAAQTFYQQVIGWTTTKWEGSAMEYTMWMAGETAIGGVLQIARRGRRDGDATELARVRRRARCRRHDRSRRQARRHGARAGADSRSGWTLRGAERSTGCGVRRDRERDAATAGDRSRRSSSSAGTS